jgi:hypothetical protein
MDLTTLARVKTHVASGEDLGTTHDTYLNGLIDLYSLQAEDMMGRTVTTATYTEYLDVEPGQHHFMLKAYPITTMSALYHDISRDFSVTAIDTDNYTTYTGTGEVVIDKYSLTRGARVLKAVYAGGMATGTSTFITSYPDIANAIDMQVAYHFSRRSSLGRSGESLGPNQISFTQDVNWLPGAKSVLLRHRRFTFGR